MLFFRLLIFVALVCAAAIFLYYLGFIKIIIVNALIVVVWVLFTPQVFQAARVLSLIQTEGRASDQLNKTFLSTVRKRMSSAQKAMYVFYSSFPYAVLVVWIAALVAYVVVR